MEKQRADFEATGDGAAHALISCEFWKKSRGGHMEGQPSGFLEMGRWMCDEEEREETWKWRVI
jgi:hypothetical protein